MPVLSAEDLWTELELAGRPTQQWIAAKREPEVAVSSISLNVAQSCNMTCSYCYADEGRFGGAATLMSYGVARAAVDRLIEEAPPRADLLIGFMGGEPLLNREVVNRLVPYAFEQADKSGRRMRFSLTTNATLINSDDVSLFNRFPFCVQVSLDGQRALNDLHRRLKGGGGSYNQVLSAIGLLMSQRPAQLSARVTLTNQSSNLVQILDHLMGLGFDDVGFGLAIASPNPRVSIADGGFERLLDEMIACGQRCLGEITAGRNYPFSNFLIAIDEIHKGTHRPYPCGAGAAYLSVSFDGEFFACHRLIGDQRFTMGNVWHGFDQTARRNHLSGKHVDRIEPCSSCWARYLCGGGCYHEVAARGRPNCNFVRGWLRFCLRSYVELGYMLGTANPNDVI